MGEINYQGFKKGTGIIVSIPDDTHDGKQNRRPGIVINSNPEYITVQLLSSRSSEYDFGSFKLNNKTQYVRSIYRKNILLNQVKGVWKDFNKKEVIQLNITGKAMNLIESNCYKASLITVSLDEYLDLKNEIRELKKENEKLKENQKELSNRLEDELELEL